MQLRSLFIGAVLIRVLSCATAAKSGLSDDLQKWIVPGEDIVPNVARTHGHWIHQDGTHTASKESKSIFEMNAQHFTSDNFHSHAVKLSNGNTYSLSYHTVGQYNITWGDVMVNPKLIRAAVQAEREAKDQAALLGFEKATSHHLDVTHPAAVELMSIFDSQDSGRWPCPVPVAINSNVADPARVIQAIEKITNLTHWEFVAWNGEDDYILVVDPGLPEGQEMCASFIGRIGGQQVIQLSAGCSAGSAAHEFLHALGVYHEHTAANRDEYVSIIDENVSQSPGIAQNFEIQRNQLQVGEYDFNSIMHYGSTAFAQQRGGQTIEILSQHVNNVCGIGQREELSFGDVSTAHAIYTLAPSYGSICASPDDTLPMYPQCDQSSEIRICGRQQANEVINGKYTLLPDTQFNGRDVYQKGDRFLYILNGEWVIGNAIGASEILAFSPQGNLDPRVTTEWHVLNQNRVFVFDSAVFGAVCDFSDDGAIWQPGQPRPSITEFDAGSRCSTSSLRFIVVLLLSSLINALWC